MEKTREQILIEKLRKAGLKMRDGRVFPGRGGRHMPHKGAPGRGPGFPCPPHAPGMPPRPDVPCGMHGMHHGPGMHGPRGGMFPREGILLAVLDADGAGVRQKDIAERIGINPSSLSEQIDRLEADRYIERAANPEDKRSTLIMLTEKGKARAWEVFDERQKRAQALCGNLTAQEIDALIALLDKLLGAQEEEK